MTASVWLDPTDDDDLDLIVSVWSDAPAGEDTEAVLALYMGAAQQQCLDYLDRELEDDVVIPDNWKLALIMQTRALWQATAVNPRDQIGEGEFQVTVYPMDWTVKNLLRPRRSGIRAH